MQTSSHEIADGVHRLSTHVAAAGPDGLTFNQYLINAEEPLLFHTGPRRLFPLVSDAAARLIDIDRLRWISFGHVESDECGAMNQWLAAAPHSSVTFNQLGCSVSLEDLCDRPPEPLIDGGTRDLGGHDMMALLTPHIPHGWEAQVLFDQTTRTLFCGDLFTQSGDGPAFVHDVDLITPALAAEDLFGATCLTAATAPTMRRLAALKPRTLALMHGPAFAGDCEQALLDLADAYEARFETACEKQSAA
jgi:flavorubredoxin